MEPIVSCQEPGCDLCSLLETISNLYNFLVGTASAGALLGLVGAGLIYILAAGDSDKINRSRRIFKASLIGFGVVLLGWLAIHSLALVLGYKNAGRWWQFQCNKGNGGVPGISENTAYTAPSSENDLPTFPDLASFLASREPRGKILGPNTASDFMEQAKALPEGGTDRKSVV